MKVERMRSDLLFPANRAVLEEAERLDVDLSPAETIHGLIHPREGMLLYVLARRAALLGDVVEIGAYLGRSTWYLARALEDAASPHRVISIDPHELPGQKDSYIGSMRRLGLADRVDTRIGYSYDIVRSIERPLGMLWIDGDHSYEAARRDFDEWFPLLAPEGWIAMHDAVGNWRGTTQLVRELLLERRDLADVGVVWLTLYGRKVAASRPRRARTLDHRARFELLALTQAARHRLRTSFVGL